VPGAGVPTCAVVRGGGYGYGCGADAGALKRIRPTRRPCRWSPSGSG